jgi:cell division protein FtsL
MSAPSVKLRALFAWMVLMPAFVSMPLAHVWSQQSYARMARELVRDGRERDRLNVEVVRLETETRGLRSLSRLEEAARGRLGMIHPGPPVLVHPGDAVPSRGHGTESGIRFAFWKGWFR